MERSAGILMPIFSLPSKGGIGALDKEAYEFADFLEKAGQKYWQILPVGPTGFGDSPYQSFSAFAGNPYFIAPAEDVFSDDEYIDYGKLYNVRYDVLRKMCRSVSDIEEFENENKWWLDDYALFMALKNHFGGAEWTRWNKDIMKRDSAALSRYNDMLKDDILFYKKVQFLFFSEWKKFKAYVNGKGIKIIGDIPIYVAPDSVDAWANPELFQFDENNLPTAVAGCPPDGFSPKGQLWGNPLYDWDAHKKSGYKWWIERMKHCFNMFDVVRIDHFRGFDEYYSVPYGAEDATNGCWKKGPGKELFFEIAKALGNRDIIAEDLGFLTDSVRKLLFDCGFPGMKVLEFAFDKRDSGGGNDYLPHNYNENCVAYTGTHDNQTLFSWYKTISEDERKLVRDYLCDYHTPEDELNMPLISLIMKSRANLCIIPMADYLCLDDRARINTPATNGGNWRWRITKDKLTENLSERIKHITKIYGRN